MEDTEALSDEVNSYVQNVGIVMPGHELRSWFHIPMYFGLGIFLLLLFNSMSWSLRLTIVAGAIVGFIDEFVKIFLATREFDFFDLLKDFVGLCIAYLVFRLFCIVRNRARET